MYEDGRCSSRKEATGKQLYADEREGNELILIMARRSGEEERI